MKKMFKIPLFASLFILLLGFGSCIDDYYESDPPFVQEYEIGTRKHPWVRTTQPGVYYCDVTINELTRDMYKNGILCAYYVYSVDDIIVDSPLPFEEFKIDNGYQWSYQYTCEFSPKRVTFISTDSSFFDEDPPACTFVVKMMK